MAVKERFNVHLRMYDLDEVSARQWEEAVEAAALRSLGNILVERSRPLFLQQTCGWPLISDLRIDFKVLAVPKYEVEGCQGHLYTSMIVVGSQSKWTTKEQLLSPSSPSKKWKVAINHIRSCSGHLLLGAFLGPHAMAAKVGEEVYTGSHLASAEAVADGRADLAAIDCVTWSLLKAARSNLTSRLRVIGTAPTLLPGLPYVVSADATEEEIEAIREAIRRCLTDEKLKAVRRALHIGDFQFDGVDLMTYQTAIKDLLSHHVVQPNHFSTVPAEPLLGQAQMAKDTDNILMAFKAWQKLCSRQLPREKFIYSDDFRFHLPGRRPMSLLRDGGPNCIGFFGERPRLHQLDAHHDHLWYWRTFQIDEAIVDALDPTVVTAYVTGHVQPGGNAFNLVVLEPGKRPEDFFKCDIHREAAEVIAPHYYRRLRIHRLRISENHEVSLERTLVKEFWAGEVSFRAVFTHPLR